MNARIEGDQTLLTSAYAWSHFDAVEALLDFGADPHAKHGGQQSLAENFKLSGPGFIEVKKHAPLTSRLRSILERTKLDAGAALAQGAKLSTIRV